MAKAHFATALAILFSLGKTADGDTKSGFVTHRTTRGIRLASLADVRRLGAANLQNGTRQRQQAAPRRAEHVILPDVVPTRLDDAGGEGRLTLVALDGNLDIKVAGAFIRIAYQSFDAFRLCVIDVHVR
ncbi:MAG: hypothetical protein ACK58T_36390, partial [Phycisphaerae bacterium]